MVDLDLDLQPWDGYFSFDHFQTLGCEQYNDDINDSSQDIAFHVLEVSKRMYPT